MKFREEGSTLGVKPPPLGVPDTPGKGGAETEKRHISGGSQPGGPWRGLCDCLEPLMARSTSPARSMMGTTFLLHRCASLPHHDYRTEDPESNRRRTDSDTSSLLVPTPRTPHSPPRGESILGAAAPTGQSWVG